VKDSDCPVIQMMIVGAPKCGTTSMKEYLGQHPEILVHPQREFTFFANDETYERGYPHAREIHFGSSLRPGARLLGKSVAMIYSQVALARLREHNPAVQIVVVLREPVARAYSEYWYARRRGHESATSFEAALGASEHAEVTQQTAYVARSCYAEHVRHLYELFPRTQVSVVLLERMEAQPVATCQALFRKIPDIDATFAPSVERRENTVAVPRSTYFARAIQDRNRLSLLRNTLGPLLSTRTKHAIKSAVQSLNDRPFAPPPIAASTQQRLRDYFEPWNRWLEDLIDEPVAEHWNV
jgi:hypothetical protein